MQTGNETDLEKLMPLVYDELRRLAAAIFSRERADHTLQPTALVHEVFLKLTGEKTRISWQNRAHFYGIAARSMRQVLVSHAVAHKAQKRGGGKTLIALDAAGDFSKLRETDLLDLDEALEKLNELDPEQARIVELRFFGGLTYEEIAEVSGISVIKARREWNSAKLFLYKMLDNR